VDHLTIILPLPPKQLSPNWRGHYFLKAKAVKTYRETAYAYALAALGRQDKPWWPAATEQTRFYFKGTNTRDPDNLASMLKPVWDGFQDAGVFANDNRLIHLPLIIIIGDDQPRVEIEIQPTPKTR
jgi:crossover junction endodeoxyribonuclease RusA